VTFSPDDRSSELRDLFFESAEEILQDMNEAGLGLEAHPKDPEKLRLCGPRHIAENTAGAMENVKFGGLKWRDDCAHISPAGIPTNVTVDPLEAAIAAGIVVVGTPDDAIAQIRRLQKKQGEFGCFLQLAHNWANFENTKKSYELWMRHVQPAIVGANVARDEALSWARDNKERFIGAAMSAAMATIQKHNEAEAKKRPKAAE